jgi:glutamyl-tRNA synthetase
MKKFRLRSAPSPTGFLHIGNLRTILFTYLIAKKLDGQYILRVEDTDQKREVEGAVENLLSILKWIGIEFDEGYGFGGDFGPYIQSERQEIYNKYLKELLEKGEAYYCFCTSERLQKMREDQQANKQAPKYDRACRDLSPEEVARKIAAGEKYVIRQKMPLEGDVKVYDEIRGEIKFKAEDLEDHVLIKSDGIPTYQFASVVDDHTMEITHVTRSEEWLPSFPKNILLYKSFGWETPKFIHFAGVLNKNGGKLSKRDGDVSVESYKEKGYLPEALINFCALLGWHPKDDNEILSLGEIIEKFEYKDIRPSGSIFDVEKLDYFNGHYIRNKNLDELVDLCKPYLEENLAKSKVESRKKKEYLKKVIRLEQERLKKLSEIGERTEFFFVDELEYDLKLLIWKKLTPADVKKNLEQVYEVLERIPEENWTNDSIGDALMSHIQAFGGKNGDYLWPMRVALTGQQASPGPFDVAEVLGKEEGLERIKRGITMLA